MKGVQILTTDLFLYAPLYLNMQKQIYSLNSHLYISLALPPLPLHPSRLSLSHFASPYRRLHLLSSLSSLFSLSRSYFSTSPRPSPTLSSSFSMPPRLPLMIHYNVINATLLLFQVLLLITHLSSDCKLADKVDATQSYDVHIQ